MSLLKTCKNGTGNLLGIFKDIGTSAPAEFRVFPEGEIFNENDSLPVYMNKESAEIVISHFESLGHDMVVDYEHQTLEGVQAPAAGWVTKIEYRDGDGLYVHTEWTEKAVQYIEKREYRYFSPVFLIDNPKDRKIVKLYNIALTNQPAMIDLDALVAKKGEKPVFEKIRKILGLDDSVTDEQMIAIVLKLVTQYQGFITKARESMDMDSWTSEEEVIVKVLTNLTENMVIASKSVLEALGVSDDAGESEVVATIHALKQGHADESEIVAMRTELAGLRKYKSEKERDLLVAEAFRREKIVFGQKAWAQNYAETDPDGFRLFIEKAPKVIDTGEIETAAGKPDRTDEDQLRINKMMGIDEETWKKYKPDEV